MLDARIHAYSGCDASRRRNTRHRRNCPGREVAPHRQPASPTVIPPVRTAGGPSRSRLQKSQPPLPAHPLSAIPGSRRPFRLRPPGLLTHARYGTVRSRICRARVHTSLDDAHRSFALRDSGYHKAPHSRNRVLLLWLVWSRDLTTAANLLVESITVSIDTGCGDRQ